MLSRIRAIEKTLARPSAMDDAAIKAGVLQHWPSYLPHPTEQLLAANIAAVKARLEQGFEGDEIYTPHIVSRATMLAIMAVLDVKRYDNTKKREAA